MSFPTEALFPTDTLLAKDSLAGKEERQRQKRPQQVTGPVHVFTAREQCFFLRQVGDEQKEKDGGCEQQPPQRVRDPKSKRLNSNHKCASRRQSLDCKKQQVTN